MPEKPLTAALKAAVKLNLALLVRCIGYAIVGGSLLGTSQLVVGTSATVAEVGGAVMISIAVLFQIIDLYRVLRGGT